MTKFEFRILNVTFVMIFIYIFFSAAKTEKTNFLLDKGFFLESTQVNSALWHINVLSTVM